ncbi:hypothetical protein F0U61_36835 [Archangium violaceum]|uniref:hypothetical protein n=1 Tax=Archangium violaceum TaxID=83451 RepID=UPI002B291C71|nr:hypothetical protein F0U61_36835 [Archangium violaceum]
MEPCEVCFNRDLWLATFTSYSTPPWPCPVCAAGTLALEKDTLLTRESFESKKDREPYPEIWDYDWTYGHFTALFQCTHADCLSSVTACGDYRVTREDDEEVGERYDYVCTPTHFNPAPPMLRHVLDALPLLEHVLGEVFEMRSKELNRLREKLLEKHDPKRAKKAPEVGA